MKEKKLTSYCGLYCLDCIPSQKYFFKSLDTFKGELDKLEFEKYAQVKANKNPTFKKYSEFCEVLEAIKKLECIKPCRENGGYPDCKIRACAIKKNYQGCWECHEYKSCELLAPLKEVHAILDDNLDLIKQVGINNWSANRGKHYSWHKS